MRISDWSSDVCSSDLVGEATKDEASITDRPASRSYIRRLSPAKSPAGTAGWSYLAHPKGFEPLASAFGGGTNIVTQVCARASFYYLSNYTTFVFFLCPFLLD